MPNTNLLFFGLILFILVGCFVAMYQKKNYNSVPRKIWTYWDSSDKLPKFAKICMESWQKYNSDYEITLLTKKNYMGYVNIPEEIATHPNFNDTPTRFSDLVRLYAISEHGGIWMDASILLKAPLDQWLFSRLAELSGFYLDEFTSDPQFPVVNSWFIACNRGSQFVRRWRDEFVEIGKYPNVEKYIESRRRQINFQKINDPISNAILISAQKVLQIDKYPSDSLILQKAEDGPIRYLASAKWDSEKALNLACSNTAVQYPLMIMRESERNIIEKYIDSDLSPNKCSWLD